LGSTLPFFAGFAMPDVFAGYAALATILILLFWERLHLVERGVLAALLVFSMCVHTSHLLNTIGATAVAIVFFLILRAPRERASAATFTIIGAVLATIALNGGYAAYVQAKTGDELHRPPFLAMRVIADGPGREYLRAACGKNGVAWTLCAFKDRPNVNSQDMLWSDDRVKGIFNVTTFENRLKMEQEETRFVLAAVAYDPGGEAWAALKNWGDQLVMVYLDDPLRNPHYYLTNAYWSTTNLPWLINHVADCGRDHWGCGARLTMDGSLWLHGILFIAGCVMIAWRLSEKDMRDAFGSLSLRFDDERGRLVATMALLVATIIVNAFVCGALSGPFARYQARIAWLADLGAGLCLASLVPEEATLSAIVQRLRAHPLAIAFERRIDPAFFRFGVVGTIGFAVHATVVHLAVAFAGLNVYLAWPCGFVVAVSTTLLLNRAFTFRHAVHHHGPWRQALIYLLVQGTGAATNFGAYAAALTIAPMLRDFLIVPLAIGSIAGLSLTFLGSKHIAFRPAKVAEAPSP